MNMASQSHVTLTHVCWWSKSHDDVSVQWELEPVRNWVCQTVLILKSQRTEMGLEINSVKSSCWDKCLHRITQTVQHNRPKCPLSSGHHLWDTFCPLSLLWTSHHQLFPSMLLFPVACYSLPLVVVLSWWSRTYKQIYVVVLEITSGLSQRKWSMCLTHRLNIKALTGMCCCYTTAPPVGQKVEKQPLLSRNENVPFLSPEFWSFVSKSKLRF